MDRPLTERPRALDILRTWFTIGTQSIGGGASTLFLMRLLLVERRRWLTAREFLEDWAISRLSPGIHLVALAGLLGRRVGGGRGSALSVIGMMLPAGLITAAMSAGYGYVRDEPVVRAALAGMGPASVGLTLGVTFALARTAVRRGRRAVVDWSVLVVAAAVGTLVTSPITIILAGAVIGAIALGHERRIPDDAPMA